MWQRRPVTAGASLLGLVALAVLAFYLLFKKPPPLGGISENRLTRLRAMVEQQEKESVEATASYAPKVTARLDDLTASVESILRQLPGVVQVEVAVQAEEPKQRIVHLRDWHFVPKDLYAMELRNSAGWVLSGEEMDGLHEELCLEVEAVQLEQMALLRCLVKHHGLKRIFCEGLTPTDLPTYNERIGVQRAMEKEEIPRLQKQLADVRDMKKGVAAAGHANTDGREKAAAIEKEITDLIWEHRKRLLDLGAAGRLLIAGNIEEVLPLEDAELLDQAKPITPDGRVMFDADKLAARRDGIVKAATARGPFALIVLGGSHDLSDSVRRLGGGTCEYLRLTTSRVRQFADGEEK
jgi:hypothetical protein